MVVLCLLWMVGMGCIYAEEGVVMKFDFTKVSSKNVTPEEETAIVAPKKTHVPDTRQVYDLSGRRVSTKRPGGIYVERGTLSVER